jgi:cellulose synthase/poly-beta-1,6-N-acetylglucosamine synthase-like glycosyltransferase
MIRALVWFFIVYFIVAYGGRVLLLLIGVPALLRGLALKPFNDMPAPHSGFEPPVSVIVPMGADASALIASARALLDLDYPQFELILVCDDGTPGGLAAVQEAFQLQPFPEALWRRIPSGEVRTVYQSFLHDHLRVLDKEGFGRADALNAGINASRYPLICAIDPGLRVQRDALQRLAEPFLEQPSTIACMSHMRVDGAGALPRSLLRVLQIVEALPALVFRRVGWDALRAAIPMPGDIVMFRKDVVVEANGFRADSQCEDTELALRLHRALRARGDRYAMRFLPDPVAWTAGHDSTLAAIRPHRRWQHGFAQGVRRNAVLLATAGIARGPALPFMLLFESYGAAIEVAGYVFVAAMWAAGLLPGAAAGAFFALTLSLGFLVTSTALLLETLSSDLYPGLRRLARLAVVAVAENLGYRQLMTFARAAALLPRRRPTA